ncbi:MAG: hypothetical protein ABW007_18250 [Chitinophagaceae bacterium]
MLAEKKQPALFIRSTKLSTKDITAPAGKERMLKMEKSSGRKVEPISAKGYIKPPKHDFL